MMKKYSMWDIGYLHFVLSHDSKEPVITILNA